MKKVVLKNIAFMLALASGTNGFVCQAAERNMNISFTGQQETNRVLTGVITDTDGQPIAGALVSAVSSSKDVITDMNGNFQLTVPASESRIKISCTGFTSSFVKLPNNDFVSVSLKEDFSLSDELIPIAQMRKETRKSITGAFSIVKGDELEQYPSAGLFGALTGRLAGLTIMQSSCEPGNDGGSMYIRGYGTTNGNAPLIILDGVPSPTIDINLFDPESIESIVILKDAAATATYGFQAANGAIVITTKRGFNGKAKVSASANFSLQQPTVVPQTLHSWEYAELRNQALSNDGLAAAFTEEQISQYKNGGNALYPDNNWYKMFMRDLATTQRYNINISGGNDRIKYFVNAGFENQGDLLKVEKSDKYDASKYMQRFNERSNLDIQILPNLSAFLNQMVVIKKTKSPSYGTGGILSSFYTTPATVPGPLTPDGGVVVTTYDAESAYGKINRSGYQRYTESTVNVAFGLNWGLDFITKGLSLKGTLGYESRQQSGIFGNISYARYIKDDSYTSELSFKPYGSWIDSSLSLSKGSNYRYFLNFNGTLNYERTFNNEHEVNAYVNYFVQDVIREGGGAQILPYDQIAFNIHAKYGYKNKYYVQADGCWMTSDQFRRSPRYGFFPTISAGWVLSNENFFKEWIGSSWLSFLKLKASYGIVGNDQITGYRYMYQDDLRLSSGGYINSLYSGSVISESLLGNSNIKWETSRQQNYGISLGLFNQFNLNFDYFYQRTNDRVGKDNKMPLMQGLTSGRYPYTNFGKVENRGFELELEYNHRFNRNWNLSASGNLSWNKSKVIDVNEVNRGSSNYYYPYRQTGYSIGQNFGYLIDMSNGNGYFNSEEEIRNSNLVYEGTSPRIGDFIYQDLNNDGIINEQDQAPIGYSELPRISYAFDAKVGYKGFDLYVMFQGIAKGSRYYSGYGVQEHYGQGVYTHLHQEAWTSERYNNGETISYPALSTSQSASNQANSFFICNTNYLRLKNVEIGYSLPKAICQKLHTNKIRFYVNGSNLLTFSGFKFKDFDPESSSLAVYPQYRTYNIGLNVVF